MQNLLWALACALCGWLEFTPAKETPLVVHEWGTFTSFSEPDGRQLAFRPLVDNELPDFVVTRNEHEGPDAVLLAQKFSLWTRQRMETPVTYFYTDRPREVRVSVDFPQGLLTEFFPPVQTMGPKLGEGGIKNGRLDWGTVRLLPQQDFEKLQSTEGALVPPTPQGHFYAHARETDAAVVEATDRDGQTRHYEKFLFYRGLGNFDLPLTLTGQGHNNFALRNTSDDEVRHVFLVRTDAQGLRFAYFPAARAHGALDMNLPSETSSAESLAAVLAKALVEEGLYDREAQAMVNTWRQSWFEESGTRVFYVMPTKWTDALIPLRVEPKPDKLVRVMVGRMEAMSPEQEKEIATLITSQSSETVMAGADHGVLAELGRFAAAAVYHVREQLDSDELKDRAARIGRELDVRESRRNQAAEVGLLQ